MFDHLPVGDTIRDEVQLVVMIALWLCCRKWGGGPERAIGDTLMAMFVADRIYRIASGYDLGWLDGAVFYVVLDASVCLALVAIALVANRKYALWIGAFQILALNAPIARYLLTDPRSVAYAINFIAPSYLQMIALTLGLLAHRRRLRRFGKYRSWRTHWPAWLEPMRPQSP